MHLSSRVRKFVAIILLIILIMSMWLIVGHPLIMLTNASIEKLHDTQFDLARTYSMLNERKALSEAAIVIEDRKVREYLQSADTASNAIVSLQRNVSQLAKSNGLTLENMSAEPPQVAEPLTKLSIFLKAKGSETALLKMIQSLENQPALIIIDKLTVVAQGVGQAISPNVPVDIVVEMRIDSYWTHPQAQQKLKS